MREYEILIEVDDEQDLNMAIDDVDLVIAQLREACYNTETVRFNGYTRK